LASRLALRHDCWALAGDSAGANLALSTALRLRGGANVPSALGLFYPLIDPTCDTASTHKYASGPVLSRDAMIWFWENYLGAERAQVGAAVLASDLSHLPPTSIVIASADPLRDEGRTLAERLRTFRVDVKLREYPGMVHGFLGLGQLTPMANKAMSDIAQDLSIQLNSCKPAG
jgi:acetyl esterase